MEKQRNIPRLRFPEFEGEWEKEVVGNLGIFTGGGTPDTNIKEYWEGNIPWISSSDIQDDTIQEYITTRSITDRAIKNSATKIVPQNSVLIVSRVGIGKFAVTKSPVCTSQDFTSLTPENANPYFLAYYFKKKTNLFLRFSQGTSIKGFTGTDIKNLVFRIPSLPEQQKIASFFTAIDQKISWLKQKKTLLEQYKKGVMQKIFSQTIRFKDDDGKEFPKWEKKRLGEVLIEHKTNNSENRFDEVFSVAKNKGVINQIEHLGRSFSAEDISNYKVINPHDIVYTKSPTSDFPFGIIKQNLLGRSGVTSPLYGVFKPETSALGFLLHNFFLSWINTYNYLNPLVQKGAKNTMNINNDDFLNGSRIALPVSEVEQTKIANFLSAIDDKINHTQTQIEKADVWKKGLMQQMFC